MTRPSRRDVADRDGAADRFRTMMAHSSSRLERARLDHPVVDAALQVLSRDRLVAGGILASAVAFRLFLWAVLLAVVAVSAFGFYLAADPAEAADLAEELGVGAFITGSVSEALAATDRGRWVAFVIGLAALAWSSRSLAVSLRAVHALAWDIRPAPPIRWTAKAVLSVAGVMAGMVVTMPLANVLRERSPGLGIVGLIGSVAVFAGLWTLASALLPRPREVPVSALVPGAVLIGVVLELLHAVSLVYLPGRFERASFSYGSLGVTVVALAWLYFSGRAVVAGAVLNATLWHRRTGVDSQPKTTVASGG